MTQEDINRIRDTQRELYTDLPKRHQQEISNALSAFNKARQHCDHKLPNGTSAASARACSICYRPNDHFQDRKGNLKINSQIGESNAYN